MSRLIKYLRGLSSWGHQELKNCQSCLVLFLIKVYMCVPCAVRSTALVLNKTKHNEFAYIFAKACCILNFKI